MSLYLIALGSNLGDRRQLLASALTGIGQRLGPVLAVSPLYATAPVGAADQEFLNGAAVARSDLDPDAALAALLDVERSLGRVRAERWGNRTVDLDLLLWREGDHVRTHRSESLELPHPRMLERDFVMVPAAEVAGGWVHPGTGRTLADEVRARGYVLGTP